MNFQLSVQHVDGICSVASVVIFVIWPFFSRKISNECRTALCGILCFLDIIIFIRMWEMWKMNLMIFYVCLFSYRICYVALTGYGVEQQEISVKENHCILRKIHDK